MKSPTLQIRTASAKTLWLTLVLLFFLFGIGEWTTRLETFQMFFTPPKMGSRHYQLGHKLALLDDLIKNSGPIDCLVLGSSMIDTGFDPDGFQRGYQEITGRKIRCFNFGIDASSATSTAALARIVMDDYQPRLLIIGTDPRDYAVPGNDRDPMVILNAPWVQYRQGQGSIEGWLLDHSYLYRYRQHLGRLARLNLGATLASHTESQFEIRPNGFTPMSKVSTYINDPPDPNDGSFEVRYYTRIFSSYTVLDENIRALESMMAYNGTKTQVLVVEMPVSDGLYYFFSNGSADYDRFVESVSKAAALYDVPFWRTEPLDSIPDHGWLDYSHLNVDGAEIFSTWLGEQVGRAEADGNFVIFQP